MTCQDCESAEQNPRWGIYAASCEECSCRALAQGPDAWRAVNGLTNAPLQSAMQTLAGNNTERYNHIRARVWHWIGRINQARGKP